MATAALTRAQPPHKRLRLEYAPWNCPDERVFPLVPFIFFSGISKITSTNRSWKALRPALLEHLLKITHEELISQAKSFFPQDIARQKSWIQEFQFVSIPKKITLYASDRIIQRVQAALTVSFTLISELEGAPTHPFSLLAPLNQHAILAASNLKRDRNTGNWRRTALTIQNFCRLKFYQEADAIARFITDAEVQSVWVAYVNKAKSKNLS